MNNGVHFLLAKGDIHDIEVLITACRSSLTRSPATQSVIVRKLVYVLRGRLHKKAVIGLIGLVRELKQ